MSAANLLRHSRKLRGLRNVIDCERSGLARYFSTGSRSFAVKENGVEQIIGGARFSQYKQSGNNPGTCKVLGGVKGSFTFRRTLANRISSGVTGLNGSLSWVRVASSRSFTSIGDLPAQQGIGMPSLSPTMTKGNIAKWVKKEGDKVSTGEVLCDVETDKVTVEVECMEDGYLAKIVQGDGAKEIKVAETQFSSGGLFSSRPPSYGIPVAESKGEASEGVGHKVLTFGRSAERVLKSNRGLALGIPKRTFCSILFIEESPAISPFCLIREKPPVISQTMGLDEYDIKNNTWFTISECFAKGSTILKPISPTGLMRPEDVVRCGGHEMGGLGVQLARQGSRIIAANLMRGVNVTKLMTLDNLLWSPKLRCLRLNHTHLVGDNKDASCPYKALHDTIDAALELSTGYGLANFPYSRPRYLNHFLGYLLDAASTDKRLITNHAVTLFPGERIQKHKLRNHVLRHKLTYERGAVKRRGMKVFADLGAFFPMELLAHSGLHPAIDYWARRAQESRRGFRMRASGSGPVILPLSDEGWDLPSWQLRVALGRILVALFRNPFEHPYGLAYDRVKPICQSTYNVLHIDNLLHNLIPLYGPRVDSSFLIRGLGDTLREADADDKPLYHSYTDINWVLKGHPLKGHAVF